MEYRGEVILVEVRRRDDHAWDGGDDGDGGVRRLRRGRRGGRGSGIRQRSRGGRWGGGRRTQLRHYDDVEALTSDCNGRGGGEFWYLRPWVVDAGADIFLGIYASPVVIREQHRGPRRPK
jgi:hypothetical protein